MRSNVAKSGKTELELDILELASLHALARRRFPGRRCGRTEAKKAVLASIDKFCGRGCRYPRGRKASAGDR